MATHEPKASAGVSDALNLIAPKTPRAPATITIYAPDGSPHVCAPIDAREILASGNGYTSEPPSVDAPIAPEPVEVVAKPVGEVTASQPSAVEAVKPAAKSPKKKKAE